MRTNDRRGGRHQPSAIGPIPGMVLRDDVVAGRAVSFVGGDLEEWSDGYASRAAVAPASLSDSSGSVSTSAKTTRSFPLCFA